MALKRMKRCSTSSGIKEMHIKSTMIHHFTSTRMTNNNKLQQITSVDEDVQKSEASYTACGNVKMHFGKEFSSFSKLVTI